MSIQINPDFRSVWFGVSAVIVEYICSFAKQHNQKIIDEMLEKNAAACTDKPASYVCHLDGKIYTHSLTGRNKMISIMTDDFEPSVIEEVRQTFKDQLIEIDPRNDGVSALVSSLLTKFCDYKIDTPNFEIIAQAFPNIPIKQLSHTFPCTYTPLSESQITEIEQFKADNSAAYKKIQEYLALQLLV